MLNKEIIADKKHINQIDEAIIAAEGRSTARIITASRVLDALADIELNHLEIPRAMLEGTKISVDINAEKLPSAYKYTAHSTWFDAIFRGGKWRITDIYRFRTGYTNKVVSCVLSETAKTALLDRFSSFVI